MDCLTQRGNSASLQFPRFALLCSFLGLYRTSERNHLFQFLRWYSYRAVNRCSGFLRSLQSSSICNPIPAPCGRGCICLRPLCHKKALIMGVYFSALPLPFASEKIYTHLFQRAAGRVGCMNLFSARPLRSRWFFRYAVPQLQ